MLILGAVVVAFFAVLSIATFYESPSCADKKQNADEEGIDCGGSCVYLCTELMQPPTVLFTKTLDNGAGRTDVIALVENKNIYAAAKAVPYRVQLYGKDQVLLQEVSGTIDLPPGVTVPVFIPDVIAGRHTISNSFLTIESSDVKWFSFSANSRVVPLVSNVRISGTVGAPRIEAVLNNPSVAILSNVRAIAIVRNDKKEVIAASSTVLPSVPAQGQATALFTWNQEFSSVPASVEVVPVVPIP